MFIDSCGLYFGTMMASVKSTLLLSLLVRSRGHWRHPTATKTDKMEASRPGPRHLRTRGRYGILLHNENLRVAIGDVCKSYRGCEVLLGVVVLAFAGKTKVAALATDAPA